MARAFWPSASLADGALVPPLVARWKGHRINRAHLDSFLRATNLKADHGLPLLYPHVLGFRLQMVVLTHPRFPVPIWRVLQIRNHLLQHKVVPADAVIDLETRTAGSRILEKGVEVDLHTVLRSGDDVAWESVNTFYVRGAMPNPRPAPASARAPDVAGEGVERWHMPSGVGWRFARLTGDYNGLHWSSAYARRLGFRRAFHHPQLVLGQCLARLPARVLEAALGLDVWLKGPVYYDSDVRLLAEPSARATRFALALDEEERPAIIAAVHHDLAGAD